MTIDFMIQEIVLLAHFTRKPADERRATRRSLMSLKSFP